MPQGDTECLQSRNGIKNEDDGTQENEKADRILEKAELGGVDLEFFGGKSDETVDQHPQDPGDQQRYQHCSHGNRCIFQQWDL